MMNRLFSLAAVVAFVCCTTSVTSADDKLEAVEKELEKAWGKFESMTADITMRTSMQGMSNKGTGTIELDHKGGKNRHRMDMKSEMDMGGQKVSRTISTVFDGEFIYRLDDTMGNKTAMKMKPGQGQASAPVGKEAYDAIKKQYELKVLPDETVDGDVAHVLEAKPKQNMGASMTTMKVYFAKKHGIMVRMLGWDADGTEVLTMNYKNIKINPKIDASRFVFKAPEGVEVQDMTNK